MKKIIILIIIILIGGLFFLFSREDTGVTKKNLGSLPDVSVLNSKGEEVKLKDFIGIPLVLNSWAVWCPFCRKELPDFAILQEEFSDEIKVIVIDRRESLEKTKSFTDEIGVTDKMLFLLNPSDSFYKKIGGFSMPETLFVDREGNIIIHKRGVMELDEMREHILKII